MVYNCLGLSNEGDIIHTRGLFEGLLNALLNAGSYGLVEVITDEVLSGAYSLHVLSLLLILRFLVLRHDSNQVEELLVLLVVVNLVVRLLHLRVQLLLLLLELVDVLSKALNLHLNVAHLFLGLVRLGLQVHLELLILLFVLLEGLLALVELLFLHDDVLVEQFRLLCLLIDRNLGHQDLARVVDEVTDCFLLLPILAEILNSLGAPSLAHLGADNRAGLRLGVGRHKSLLVVAQALQRLGFEHLRVLGVENVQLLLVLSVVLHLILVGIRCACLLLVVVSPEGWDVVDDTDCTWAVYPRRDSLFPDAQVVLLKLVEIFEFALKFARHEQVLSLFMHTEQVVIIILELLELDLIQAERR